MRSFEPWYLNPLKLWVLAHYQNGPWRQRLVRLDFSWLLRRAALRLAAQLYADDIQVDRRTQHDKKPEELGYTLSLRPAAPCGGQASWSAFYTRVDAPDYRTRPTRSSTRSTAWASRGITPTTTSGPSGSTTAPAPRALVSGEITYHPAGRRVTSDSSIPPDSAFSDSLIFLTGVVERTLRVAAQANWTPVPGINLSTDIGRHFIWNANHVQGVRGDRWVWRVRAEIRRRITGAVHWPD